MNVVQHILVTGLRLYRWAVSPLIVGVFGPLARCRFEPTCSAYALEAIKLHGARRGSWLAVCRLGRCHPWGGCGHDPVPPLEHRFLTQPTPSTEETSSSGRYHLPDDGDGCWGSTSAGDHRARDLAVARH